MIESRPAVAAPDRLAITDGGRGDLDRVMEVMASAFASGHGEAWTRTQCLGILGMAGVALRIARIGDRTAGFALSRKVADEAELLLLAVAPPFQRAGIGQALLTDFIILSRRSGAQHLHLEVRDGNPAITLYEANRFAIAGRRRDYYRGADGFQRDALTLRRND